jgi:hypothetical protein
MVQIVTTGTCPINIITFVPLNYRTPISISRSVGFVCSRKWTYNCRKTNVQLPTGTGTVLTVSKPDAGFISVPYGSRRFYQGVKRLQLKPPFESIHCRGKERYVHLKSISLCVTMMMWSDTATIPPWIIRIPRLIESPVRFLNTTIHDTKVIKKITQL